MKSKSVLYGLALVVSAIAWEHYGQNYSIVRLLVSSPSLTANYMAEHFVELRASFWVTFFESVSGLLLAMVFSFSLMVLCLRFTFLMELVLPVLVVSQVIPLITLAPLLILLFGLGIRAKIVMAALLCFFPIFVNFAAGVRVIPASILELLYLYNASFRFKIIHIFFPLALPYTMAGLKVSSTLAVIGAIVGEFNGAEVGLGKNLFLAAKRLEPELMISSLLLSATLGGALYASVLAIESAFGGWYIKNHRPVI